VGRSSAIGPLIWRLPNPFEDPSPRKPKTYSRPCAARGRCGALIQPMSDDLVEAHEATRWIYCPTPLRPVGLDIVLLRREHIPRRHRLPTRWLDPRVNCARDRGKKAACEVGAALCFAAVMVERPLVDPRVELERGDQALIACISGPTPKIQSFASDCRPGRGGSSRFAPCRGCGSGSGWRRSTP